MNRAYAQRALLDENVQYLLLAVYWYFQVRFLIYFVIREFGLECEGRKQYGLL